MGRRLKAMAAIAAVIVLASPLWATRIGITYKGADYILNTSRSIGEKDTAYFSGMYDAFACVSEGKKLSEIHEVIQGRSFAEDKGTDAAAMRKMYEEAFLDFMTSYTYGGIGEYKDIMPLYRTAISGSFTYRSALVVVELGGARFFMKNI